jgi:carbamoyl-phosphate synthase large subunit
MVGMKLKDLGVLDFDFTKVKHMSMKESVFPFNKFPKVKMFLGPEMRSTGEVMGISQSFGAAVAKAQLAAGNPLPKDGTIFVSVNNNDKTAETIGIMKDYANLGFKIIATEGTTKVPSKRERRRCELGVFKVNEGRPNIVDAIKNGEVQMVINTPLGEESRYDEYSIGWAAIQQKIAFITTLSAAATAVKGIERIKQGKMNVKSIQEYHQEYQFGTARKN